MTADAELRRALRVLVVTDAGLTRGRSVVEVARAALSGGAGAVQLRNKGASARELLEVGGALRALTRAAGALLFVNDRLDVALALGADGVHLGPHDLPVAAARAVAPRGFLVGRSADDPEVARLAVLEGADYIGCGTVYPTLTKPDAGGVVGPEGLRSVVEAVPVPVVGIGGITVERATEVAGSGAAGVAVVGAIMGAEDPAEAVRALRAAFERGKSRG